jgi:hypothetical protein
MSAKRVATSRRAALSSVRLYRQPHAPLAKPSNTAERGPALAPYTYIRRPMTRRPLQPHVRRALGAIYLWPRYGGTAGGCEWCNGVKSGAC